MSKQLYITTAIPYANARPHIGHVLVYLLADAWRRHQESLGFTVRFSAGLDEHGTKIENKATAEGTSPQEFVDKLAPEFKQMLEKLNVAPTDYVRTSDAAHVGRVQEIWAKLDAAGLIYKGTYEGWYCAGCESFLTETEAKAVNYECADHKTALEKVAEDNYYLKVSQFSEEIKRFVSQNIVPVWRGKEILEMVKNGAQDVSISRPVEKLQWGIAVPNDPSQVMYVWVDALSNYLTALGYPDAENYTDWWPAQVEVIGKDILRFHAVIWPAILLGLGLELPKKLLVHIFSNKSTITGRNGGVTTTTTTTTTTTGVRSGASRAKISKIWQRPFII